MEFLWYLVSVQSKKLYSDLSQHCDPIPDRPFKRQRFILVHSFRGFIQSWGNPWQLVAHFEMTGVFNMLITKKQKPLSENRTGLSASEAHPHPRHLLQLCFLPHRFLTPWSVPPTDNQVRDIHIKP